MLNGRIPFRTETFSELLQRAGTAFGNKCYLFSKIFTISPSLSMMLKITS